MTKKILQKCSVIVTVLAASLTMFPQGARAEVGNWQKSVIISSRSNTDFDSGTFKQSVQNAARDHVNMITLSFPWYQSNLYSTDIQAGWQTPTDQALARGIDYIHGLGLAVTLKPHLESYTGEWRAYINPSDKTTWFSNYGRMLNNVGAIAQQHKVEQIIIGSELINMSSKYSDPSNTQNWKNMIAALRKIYGGKLTYSANWGESWFAEEKNQIEFWSSLDYLGTNGYYELRTDSTDSSQLAGWWSKWENEHIIPWRQANGNKPVVFTETGYKSVPGAQWHPWDYTMGGQADETTQANLYDAFFKYWGAKPYVSGLHVWEWSSDPSYGGPGNTDYTPQGKKAEAVMASWFNGGGTPLPPPSTTTPPSATCGTAGTGTFTGCYYNGRNFENLALSRNDTAINFDWGYGSPDPKVGADNFSVQWEGNFNFESSNYAFSVTADDGIKVLIDGAVTLDKWLDQPVTTYTFNKALSAGSHNIKVMYYENGGGAAAKVSWAKAATPTPTAASCPQAAVGTFTACYYNGRNFETFVSSRSETAINYDWGGGSPLAGIAADNFSVSWEGVFDFGAGDYQFTATADDGIQITVDGVAVIDKWIDQPPTAYSATKTLTAGKHTVKILYYEKGGGAVAKAGWTKVTATPAPTPTPPGGTNPPPNNAIVYVDGYPTLNGNYIDCYGNIDNDMAHHTQDPNDTDPGHRVGQNCPAGSFVGAR